MPTKTPTDEFDVQARVTAGIVWLDANAPWRTWASVIDPERLDLAECTACVLGQIYGSYWDAPIAPEMRYVPDVAGNERVAALGFTAHHRSVLDDDVTAREYEALNREWQARLAVRCAEAGVR